MLNEFIHNVSNRQLFDKSDQLLVAVSGGKDSMVLVDVLRHHGFSFGVAHVNFQLRGSASDGDEAFVRTYCDHYELAFFTVRFETRQYASANAVSTQMAARELRYNWFEKIRSENNYSYILTAHHKNDDLETALLNFTRGTGIAGLTGIAPKRGFLVRPLLFYSREEMDVYAAENNVSWREDVSNAATYYSRNRIRHKVIPELKAINPKIEAGFDRTLERLKAAEFAWDILVEDIKNKCWIRRGDVTEIDAELIKSHPHAFPLLEALLLPHGFFRQQLTDLLSVENSGTFFSETHALFVRQKSWSLVQNNLLKPFKQVFNELPTTANVHQGFFSFELVNEFPTSDELKNPAVAFLDYSKLNFPITIRTWQEGDRFQPFGMKGSKLISDFLIDLKMPLLEKKRQLLLTDNERIAWVVGQRVSQLCSIDPGTEQILQVSFVKKS